MLSNYALARLVTSPSPSMSVVWLHEGKLFVQVSVPSLFVCMVIFVSKFSSIYMADMTDMMEMR